MQKKKIGSKFFVLVGNNFFFHSKKKSPRLEFQFCSISINKKKKK